jgi:hypothetical protein
MYYPGPMENKPVHHVFCLWKSVDPARRENRPQILGVSVSGGWGTGWQMVEGLEFQAKAFGFSSVGVGSS